MKEEIEQALQDLIGLQLTKTTKAATMECLQFGQQKVVDKKEELMEIGAMGLHVQCSWRIVNQESILIGSLDVYEPKDEKATYQEDFDWQAGNLRDATLQRLIATSALVVEAIAADAYGGVDITFSNQIKLQLFPAYSKVNEYTEHWRVLDNRPESNRHIVVSGSGVEIV